MLKRRSVNAVLDSSVRSMMGIMLDKFITEANTSQNTVMLRGSLDFFRDVELRKPNSTSVVRTFEVDGVLTLLS